MRNPRQAGASKLAGSSNTPTPKPIITQKPKLSRSAKWQQAHPKATWAHSCLRSAIRRGLIERQPCEICGAEPTDGHHKDYDVPMRVTWLCRRCHKAAHRQRGGDGR